MTPGALAPEHVELVRRLCGVASAYLTDRERAAARAWRAAGHPGPRPATARDLLRAALFGAAEQLADACAQALDGGQGPDLRVVPRQPSGGPGPDAPDAA